MPNADVTGMFVFLLIFYLIMAALGCAVNRVRTEWLGSAAITADDLEELERLSRWRDAQLAAWKAGRIGWMALILLATSVFGVYIGGFFMFAVLVFWASAWYDHVMAGVAWRKLRPSARARLKADEGKRRFLWMVPAGVAILCIGWPTYVGIQETIEYQRRAAPVVADSGVDHLAADRGVDHLAAEKEEPTEYDVRFDAAWELLKEKYPDLADEDSTFSKLLMDKNDAAIGRNDPAVEDPEYLIKFADELADRLAGAKLKDRETPRLVVKRKVVNVGDVHTRGRLSFSFVAPGDYVRIDNSNTAMSALVKAATPKTNFLFGAYGSKAGKGRDSGDYLATAPWFMIQTMDDIVSHPESSGFSLAKEMEVMAANGKNLRFGPDDPTVSKWISRINESTRGFFEGKDMTERVGLEILGVVKKTDSRVTLLGTGWAVSSAGEEKKIYKTAATVTLLGKGKLPIFIYLYGPYGGAASDIEKVLKLEEYIVSGIK